MMLLKPIGARLDSDDMRRVARDENFDEQAVVYLGRYIGYRDAPSLPDEAAQQAREAIADRFETEYNITVEVLSAAEQERELEQRFGEDREEWPEWAE